MGFANGNSYGSSAAAVREETCERPANSWLFTVAGIPNQRHATEGM